MSSEHQSSTSQSQDAPAPATIGPDTDLKDLTDLQIQELTEQIKECDASARPLVSELEPLNSLAEEYAHGNATFRAKIDDLGRKGWKGIRRIRGDGNCLYRALAVAELFGILEDPQREEKARQASRQVEEIQGTLDRAGFERMVTEDFVEPLTDLLKSLSSSTPPSSSSLLQSLNDPETSNSLVVFYRLATSAHLRLNPDEFLPFLFAYEGELQLDAEGMPDMRRFCENQVEATGREADHVQMAALAQALGLKMRVAYLDGSGASAGGEPEVDWHEFGEGRERTFLYRPGHYDLLSQKEA